MPLEPPVLNRIRQERRKGRLQRALIRLPLLLGIAACLIIIVLELAVWSGTEGMDTPSRIVLWIVLGLFAVSLLAFTAWFGSLRANARRITGRIASPGEGRGGGGLKRFGDAMDAVAIGAGIPAPRLLVAALPTVNALPVYRDGQAFVAVTEEALGAGLSMREAEAMMAQAMSQVMLGYAWGTPVIFRSGLVPFFLLGVFSFTVVIALLLVLPGQFVFIPLLSGLAILGIAGPVGSYLFRHGDEARAHSDALADSIAVRITGDPGAMRELLKRLAAGMREVEFTPELQYVSRYLFLCPPGAASDEGDKGYEDYEEEKGEEDDEASEDMELARRQAFRKVVAKTLDYANKSLALRLANLEMIERTENNGVSPPISKN